VCPEFHEQTALIPGHNYTPLFSAPIQGGGEKRVNLGGTMNGPRSFKNQLDQISEFFLKVNGFVCLLLPVIILVVVVVRAVSPKGIPLWSIDICELLMWFLTFLCTGFIFRLGRHITVDVAIKNLKPPLRKIIDIGMLVIVLVMSIIMMVGGFDASLQSWMSQKKTSNEFPAYLFSVAIPLGLTFLVYEVICSLVKRFSSENPAQRAGH
jgi:TRAP-type C4-dicarboxylate transport system permease small subunit